MPVGRSATALLLLASLSAAFAEAKKASAFERSAPLAGFVLAHALSSLADEVDLRRGTGDRSSAWVR